MTSAVPGAGPGPTDGPTDGLAAGHPGARPEGAAPRVSVVVPCYNSAWSVGDTLRSILAQTMGDLEILLVDDGSTDGLGAVLAQQDDPRLRVIRQPNGGLAAARNRGLAAARGAFVGFLDADDLWHPDFLAQTLAALEADPAAPYAFAWSFHLDEHNRFLAPPPWGGMRPRHDLVGMVQVNLVGNGSAALFRADPLRAVGGFDRSMGARGAHGAEDWKLCLQLAAEGTPALVPQALVGYRQRRAGMSQGDPRRQMAAVDMVIADLAPRLPQVPARAWRDAKVTLNGWLLPAYLRRGFWWGALRLLAQSYLGNPGWILVPALRRLHAARLRQLACGPFAPPPPPLAGRRDPDGRRPFAFLGPAPLPSSRSGVSHDPAAHR